MAAVSITYGPEVPGSRKEVFGTITFDSSYPTGGEAFTPAQFGLNRLDWLQLSNGQGYVPLWDGSTSAPKVVMYRQGASAGALAETPNTTDLSAITVRFRATGA